MAAAGKAGARLVVLDNLYAVGRTGGRAMDGTTPASPCSRKGAIRARLAASLQEAVRRGDVRAVTGRASDFFGPGGVLTAYGERFWTRLFAGKGAEVLGNPDTLHTYHFIPDVAAGLAALGEAGDEASGAAEGKRWILPCAPAGTTRQLVAWFASAAGVPAPVRRMPRPVVKILGLFMPILREVDEMLYQWDEPYVADDRAFRATLRRCSPPRPTRRPARPWPGPARRSRGSRPDQRSPTSSRSTSRTVSLPALRTSTRRRPCARSRQATAASHPRTASPTSGGLPSPPAPGAR